MLHFMKMVIQKVENKPAASTPATDRIRGAGPSLRPLGEACRCPNVHQSPVLGINHPSWGSMAYRRPPRPLYPQTPDSPISFAPAGPQPWRCQGIKPLSGALNDRPCHGWTPASGLLPVFLEPRHDLDKIAGPVAVVELPAQ